MATNSCESAQKIVASVVKDISNPTSLKLPKISSIKMTIRRDREKDEHPANSVSLQELSIPNKHAVTENDDEFLQFDSGSEDDRIIIFSTRKSLTLLSSSDHWFADGTFDACPSLFYQLYTIHGMHEN